MKVKHSTIKKIRQSRQQLFYHIGVFPSNIPDNVPSSMFAPFAKRILTTSSWPRPDAMIKPVFPFESLAWTDTPDSKKDLTVAISPVRQLVKNASSTPTETHKAMHSCKINKT